MDLSNTTESRRGVTNIRPVKYHKHYFSEEQSGICVVRRKDESDDELLKRFRKKYSKSGLAKELRDRMYYEKPSSKRRRKRMQSIRLIKQEAQKQEQLQEDLDNLKSNFSKNNNTKERKQKNDYSSRG